MAVAQRAIAPFGAARRSPPQGGTKGTGSEATCSKVRDECILLPRMGHSSGVPSFLHLTQRDDTLFHNVYWCTFVVHLLHSEAKLQLVPLMGHSNLLRKFGTRAASTSVSNGFPSLGAPLRSATGAMTQCNDSNVYWHPIVLNTLLKISYYIYVKI